MPNPFFYGGRVDPSQFVGREQELRNIFNCLETAHTGQMQSVSIVGPHRIGRSSLLYYVVSKYSGYLQNSNSYRFAYISLHDADCHTPNRLLQKILQELKINSKGRKSTTSPSEFQDALKILQKQRVKPVVCLDEFEELIQTGAFENEFFDSWRHLMSNSEIAFVIASTRFLNELVAPDKYTSSFFNIFTVMELGEFTEDDANQIIQRGRVSDRPFDSDDVKYMRRFGGKHPYKLQLAGAKIYLAKTGITIDWKKVEQDIESQVRQAGLENKIKWHKTAWQNILVFLRSLGRAVLEVRRDRNEISESTALWWGIIVILIPLLILVGWIPIGWLLKFGSHWLGK
jgi:AAA+ ATPase superfamily predicted ATPase